MLGLLCCTRALSNCGERGLIPVALHRPLPVVASPAAKHRLQTHGLQRLWHAGFSSCGSQAQQPWRTGSVALRHVGSSRTGARTRVPCIGRRIPNHSATREAQDFTFESQNFLRELSSLKVTKKENYIILLC